MKILWEIEINREKIRKITWWKLWKRNLYKNLKNSFWIWWKIDNFKSFRRNSRTFINFSKLFLKFNIFLFFHQTFLKAKHPKHIQTISDSPSWNIHKSDIVFEIFIKFSPTVFQPINDFSSIKLKKIHFLFDVFNIW